MTQIFSTIIMVGLVLGFSSVSGLAEGEKTSNAHEFQFTDIDEETPLPLKAFKGKAVLIVNTASFCGFTRQYEGLQALWERYGDKGLVVLGVPSNDFGGQEPKQEKEIAQFCQGAFGVTFPLTTKVRVKGEQAHPFYRWVSRQTDGRADPSWNFHKLLIGADGKLEAWFASGTRPMAKDVTDEIERVLGAVG